MLKCCNDRSSRPKVAIERMATVYTISRLVDVELRDPVHALQALQARV
jgi:hypothetical protein